MSGENTCGCGHSYQAHFKNEGECCARDCVCQRFVPSGGGEGQHEQEDLPTVREMTGLVPDMLGDGRAVSVEVNDLARAIGIGLTWVPLDHRVAPVAALDELVELICAQRELDNFVMDGYVEALMTVDSMLSAGCSPGSIHAYIEARVVASGAGLRASTVRPGAAPESYKLTRNVSSPSGSLPDTATQEDSHE